MISANVGKMDGGYQVDAANINVFVISSVAGGTGAGMFLDTAFLIKDINANIHPTGILFLPSLFDGIGGVSGAHKQVCYSNGYASLMELDNFMAPMVGSNIDGGDDYPKFTFNWDGDPHTVLAPPFNNVYFVDSQNNSDKRLSMDQKTVSDQ